MLKGNTMLSLTWHGHACFELWSNEYKIVFDPYERGYVRGLELPELCADMVISSHRHRDHYAPDAVTLTGNEPDVTVVQIPCFHDDKEGKLRGDNLISVVEAEGLRICHMGDIGHLLSKEQLAALGEIDILMLPVGGFFTVDAKSAKKLCDAIKPKTVIPMHYRSAGKGIDRISPVDDFISLFKKDEAFFLSGTTASSDELLKHKIAVFPWP